MMVQPPGDGRSGKKLANRLIRCCTISLAKKEHPDADEGWLSDSGPYEELPSLPPRPSGSGEAAGGPRRDAAHHRPDDATEPRPRGAPHALPALPGAGGEGDGAGTPGRGGVPPRLGAGPRPGLHPLRARLLRARPGRDRAEGAAGDAVAEAGALRPPAQGGHIGPPLHVPPYFQNRGAQTALSKGLSPSSPVRVGGRTGEEGRGDAGQTAGDADLPVQGLNLPV